MGGPAALGHAAYKYPQGRCCKFPQTAIVSFGVPTAGMLSVAMGISDSTPHLGHSTPKQFSSTEFLLNCPSGKNSPGNLRFLPRGPSPPLLVVGCPDAFFCAIKRLG